MPSRMGKLLINDASIFWLPGPFKIDRAALPNRNGPGEANAAVLNHRARLRSDEESRGFPTRSARSVPAGNALVWFPELYTVNGGPDWNEAIAPTRQPPKSRVSHARFRSSGKSYTPLSTARCRTSLPDRPRSSRRL